MKYNITQEWLTQKYLVDLDTVEAIASEVGCTVANIRRYLKKWKITRGKILFNLGMTKVWNRGLTKDTNTLLQKLANERLGDLNPMSGKDAWNKGLTKDDDERLMKISEMAKTRTPSDEVREKMANAKRGLFGPLSNRWKGGKTYANGYGINRKTVDGVRVYEHRYVAETFLGRPLQKEEHVHHIDRVKSNNSPENLLILDTTDHNRLHRAISRGFETKEQQINWLTDNGILFVEIR